MWAKQLPFRAHNPYTNDAAKYVSGHWGQMKKCSGVDTRKMYQSAVLHWSRYDIADKCSWGKQSKYEQVNSWYLEQRSCASKQTLVILIRYPLIVFKGTLSYARFHIVTIYVVVLRCICFGICSVVSNLDFAWIDICLVFWTKYLVYSLLKETLMYRQFLVYHTWVTLGVS